MTRVSGSTSSAHPMQPVQASADHIKRTVESNRTNILGNQYQGKPKQFTWTVSYGQHETVKITNYFHKCF